ncbi:TfoX/Sxy family protein [Burkholderia ubonensis]|uniref:TfoX/Sxy family protein n=1 Tax=Burkholderia ubonensis TaxID=101571 RepID=UPI0007600430|nr:TfoX/Sxy family protein [Burkholderia ubonensis]KWI73988.1 competence protein TfoX [Burkholderia ubonensis]
MASSQSTVDFIVEQTAAAGAVSARKMFGEYGIYCDGKMVALVCDDRLFVKPTPDGKAFLGECEEGPPYPGAKPCFVISGERWDEREWLARLIRITAAQLPPPKPRKR